MLSNKLVGVAAGLAAGALWGLVFVAPRMVPMGEGGYSSIDLTAARFAVYGVIAALVMLAIGMTHKTRRLPSFSEAAAAIGMSLLGFTVYYLLLVLAVRDAGSEVPSLIIGTIPLWVMLLGKPAGLQWAALLLGLVLTCIGLVLMTQAAHTQGSLISGSAPGDFWRGIAFAVASLVCWTLFALLNARWLKRHPAVTATDWANWLGVATGLCAALIWLSAGSPWQALAGRDDLGRFVLLSVLAGAGSTWLATIFWNIASQRLSASLCGQLIVSETIFALLYSFMWNGRWPNVVQWAACALFTIGIVASIRAHR